MQHLPQEGTVPRVLQITEIDLCREHRNHKKTLSRTPRKFTYCCTFNLSFAQNTFFVKGFLYSRSFQNIQGLLWKIQGLFKDVPQFSIFNFQGRFKDMMLFQGLFKARANHANTLIHPPISEVPSVYSIKRPTSPCRWKSKYAPRLKYESPTPPEILKRLNCYLANKLYYLLTLVTMNLKLSKYY